MSQKDLVHDLTLVLLYLNSWVEGEYELDGEGHEMRRAWRGADWDALDALRDEGLLDFANRAKSVYITDEGQKAALRLLDVLGLAERMSADDPPPIDVDNVRKEGRKTMSARAKVPAFTFRMDFRFYELVCWRELRVPKSFSFEDLHTAIQACFNWLNYHLYDFKLTSRKREWQVSWPDFETGGNPLEAMWHLPGEKLPEWHDSADTVLTDVFPRVRKMLYTYDYGDYWQIDMRLVDSKTPLDSDTPICVGGEGDCPPDDVGGEGGFCRLLEIMGDPEDEEYEYMCGWAEGQGFEHFNQDHTNERLRHYNDWRVKGVYGD